MNGPLAQIVALTCHGNAFLAGRQIPPFFPTNSTCQFCDSISFICFKKPLLGKLKETAVAAAPDEWFSKLRERGAAAIRLVYEAQDNPQITIFHDEGQRISGIRMDAPMDQKGER